MFNNNSMLNAWKIVSNSMYGTIGGQRNQDHLGTDISTDLPSAIRVASKLIGTDIVSVKPLSTPAGALFYLDFNPQDHLGIRTI